MGIAASGIVVGSTSAEAWMPFRTWACRVHRSVESGWMRVSWIVECGSSRWAGTEAGSWQLAWPCCRQALGHTLFQVHLLRTSNINDTRKTNNVHHAVDVNTSTHLTVRSFPMRCWCCTGWDARGSRSFHPGAAAGCSTPTRCKGTGVAAGAGYGSTNAATRTAPARWSADD